MFVVYYLLVEIPYLYSPEEIDSMVSDYGGRAKAAGYALERNAVYEYFLAQVKENVHCIVCASQDWLRTASSKFPSITSNVSADYFHPWAHETLMGVGQRYLKDLSFEEEEVRNGVESFTVHAFETLPTQMPPKLYLDHLKLYSTMLATKRSETKSTKMNLATALKI